MQHFLQLFIIILAVVTAAEPDTMSRPIDYSDKYQDGNFEYRHVILPKEIAKALPKGRILTESEWRGFGIQQSRGWAHYALHRPEQHILLFRRPLGTDPVTGQVSAELEREAKELYQQHLLTHMRK